MKLFLIGMMGSGKSYWSKIIAHQLQLKYYDLDTVIENNCSQTIGSIFEQLGEVYFREQERIALHTFEHQQNFVLATGGGTPCFNNNMQWMNEQGITIFIDEPIDVLVSRLKKEKEHRPLIKQLDDADLTNFLTQKLAERKAFYNQAKFKVNSEILSTEVIFEMVNRR